MASRACSGSAGWGGAAGGWQRRTTRWVMPASLESFSTSRLCWSMYCTPAAAAAAAAWRVRTCSAVRGQQGSVCVCVRAGWSRLAHLAAEVLEALDHDRQPAVPAAAAAAPTNAQAAHPADDAAAAAATCTVHQASPGQQPPPSHACHRRRIG